MRTRPSKEYSPNPKMTNNMTLYEMAYSMSEDGDAQAGLPYLTEWLFKDYFNNYKYKVDNIEENIPDSYKYNITYFVMNNFINRESCHKVPEVFRQYLLTQITNMNLEKDFYDLLIDLKNKDAALFKNVDIDSKKDTTDSNTRTDNLNESYTSSETINTGNQKNYNTQEKTILNDTTTASNTGTVTDQKTVENTRTLNTQSQRTDNLTENVSEKTDTNTVSRDVASDYPQSTVDTTVPLDWDYASGAHDNKTDTDVDRNMTDTKTGTQTTNNTGTVGDDGNETNTRTLNTSLTEARTGQDTLDKTGTDTEDTEGNAELQSTKSNTGTVNDESKESQKIDAITKIDYNKLSAFELSQSQLEIYNRYKSFYLKLIKNLEKCFISIYVEEDRDGYIDPLTNLYSRL